MTKHASKWIALLAIVLLSVQTTVARADNEYNEDEILSAAEGFFGATSKGIAKVIQKIFSDHGRPNAYIAGEEIAGAIGIGLRYGKGHLFRKKYGGQRIYWQGPSIGFDLGGNASKVFTLIYNLNSRRQMYRRFPGGEGTIYVVAGFGVNYQQRGRVILAPIRTGVGLRAGVNIGYLHYGPEYRWLPF